MIPWYHADNYFYFLYVKYHSSTTDIKDHLTGAEPVLNRTPTKKFHGFPFQRIKKKCL